MSFLKKIMQRWRSESPAFFKFLTNLFVTIGGMALGVIALEQSYPNRFPFLTGSVNNIIDYCLILGAIGAVLAKMTVKNGNQPNQQT